LTKIVLYPTLIIDIFFANGCKRNDGKGQMGRMMPKPEEPQSLSERIYFELRESILKGELKPGAHLLVLDIAKAKGVSQAPVREALERLKQEGLLIRQANRSAVVSDISLKEIEDIYALRELIEGYAVERTIASMTERDFNHLHGICLMMKEATQKDDLFGLIYLDMDFHGFFYEKCGNKAILDVWKTIRTKIMRFISVTNRIYFSSLESVADSHFPLLETLRAGDPAKASEAFRNHMKEVWWRMKKS
jgi:DNA-binding GntR family transcriptional regulator